MTIDTETIRDAAEVLDTLTSTLAVDHPLYTQAAARAKSCVSGLYSAANALDAQTTEIARLRAVAQMVSDALKNYERMGEVCPFEGQPMIYAETLIEIGEAARAALSGESKC